MTPLGTGARNLLDCTAMPQPTAQRRALQQEGTEAKM